MLRQEFNFAYENTIPIIYDMGYKELNSGVLDMAIEYLNSIRVDGWILPSGEFLVVKNRNLEQVENSHAFLQRRDRDFKGELIEGSPLFLTVKNRKLSEVSDNKLLSRVVFKEYNYKPTYSFYTPEYATFAINNLFKSLDSRKRDFTASNPVTSLFRQRRKDYIKHEVFTVYNGSGPEGMFYSEQRQLTPTVQLADIFKEHSAALSKGQMLKKFFSHVGLELYNMGLDVFDSFNVSMSDNFNTNYNCSDSILMSSNFAIIGYCKGQHSPLMSFYGLEKTYGMQYQEVVFNTYSLPKELKLGNAPIHNYKKEKGSAKSEEHFLYKEQDYKALVNDFLNIVKPDVGLSYTDLESIHKDDLLETEVNEQKIITKGDTLSFKQDTFKEISRNYIAGDVHNDIPVNYYEIGVLKDDYFDEVEASIFRKTYKHDDLIINKRVNSTTIDFILEFEKSKPSEIHTNVMINVFNVIKDTEIEHHRIIIDKEVIKANPDKLREIVEILARDVQGTEQIIYEQSDKISQLYDKGIEYHSSARSIEEYKKRLIYTGDKRNTDMLDSNIDIYKGLIDSQHINDNVIYHRVKKEAKPYDYFVLHIPVHRPDPELNVNEDIHASYIYLDYNVEVYDTDTSLERMIDAPNLYGITDLSFERLIELPDPHKYNEVWGYRPITAPNNSNYDKFFSKSNTKDTNANQVFKYLGSGKKLLEAQNNFLWYNKNKVGVIYNDNSKSLSLDLENLSKLTTEKFLSKEDKAMWFTEEVIAASKDKSNLYISHSDLSIGSGKNKTLTHTQSYSFSSKDQIGIVHKLYEQFMSRGKKEVTTMNEKDLDIMISKRGRIASIAKDYLSICNSGKDTGIEDSQSLKMIVLKPRSINAEDTNLAVFKNYRPVMIESKNKFAYYISGDTSLFDHKEYRYAHRNHIIIAPRDTMVQYNLFVTARALIGTAFFNTATWAYYYGKSTKINDETDIGFDTIRTIREFNSTVTSDVILRSISYHGVNSASVTGDTIMVPEFEIFLPKTRINTMLPHLDFLQQDKYAKSIAVEDDLFAGIIRELTPQDVIAPKSGEIHRNLSVADDYTSAKVDIGDEKQNNFFNSLSLGPDDLIMPNVDFDYSEFKKQLINPETGKPIKPVAVIDANTFIGRFPVNHPLPEIPISQKEKWVQVDGQLIKLLIEIAHKIWRDNIFKFGAMDMREAVAKLVEYMEVFVSYRVPEQLHDQARRVIKLFRWYGESAIVRKANYEIKIEYEEFKAKFHEGHLGLPHIENNFIVDHTRYVLANETTGIDSMIEIEVRNSVETPFRFVASFNIGELEVYLNGELQYTLEPRFCRESIILPERIGLNPSPNMVKMVYKNPGPGVINIGGIVIDNYRYKDITTTYSPKPGSGNMVIDDIMKKASSYALVVDEQKGIVDQMLNNNLAIGEMVNMLVDYFNKHHADKHKYQKINNNRGKGGF